MKISIQQKLLLFSFIILASNCFIGYAVYKSNQKHLEAERQVKHSEQVIYQSDKIYSLGKDIVIAARGFVITNDSVCLEPLYTAEKTIFTYIGKLRQLTRDDPAQQQRIDSLSFYIQKRLSFALQTVELRNRKGLSSTIDFISNAKGRQYNKRIQQITNSIQQEENNLLKHLKQANDSSVSALGWFTMFMFILMTVFTVMLLIATRNNLLQNKATEKREAALIIANKELAFQDEHIAHLAAIVESSENAIVSLSLDGTVISWNMGAEKIFGYTANEVIGKQPPSIIPPDDINNTNIILERVRNNEIIGGYETERIKKNGERFNVSLFLAPMKDHSGRIIGVSIIAHDITFRKKSELEIIQKSEELVRANKELALQYEEKKKQAADLTMANIDLTTLTYVSSHDLQEPLRKIQNFITLILEDEEKKLSDKGKSYFKRIQETAKRMQSLIEDLLTYSRTKTTERIFENTDLNIILDEVKSNFEEIMIEKNATIKVITTCEVRVIPFQFRQLFHNLISNSLKFSNPQLPPYITIACRIENGSTLTIEKLSPNINYAHIVFTDNGIGFDPQYQDRIFEVFQRLNSYERYKGTGIGLAICKRIVENHKGIITATGELNKGARFDIYIPAN